MAGRHSERSKSRCNPVSPIPKRKLADQIYLRARHFAPRISRQKFVERGSKGPALDSRLKSANREWRHSVRVRGEGCQGVTVKVRFGSEADSGARPLKDQDTSLIPEISETIVKDSN